MIIAHLMASPFVGGPERQLLGLARHLPATSTSVFFTFPENGKAQAFLDEAREQGFEGLALAHKNSSVRSVIDEIAENLRRVKADILTCSGYKPDILGWRAARKVGIPVVSISHGWTAATLKVRLNELLDRVVLRWLDAVVCVSQAQARRVRRSLIPKKKIVVIHNAITVDAFNEPDP